MQIIGIGFGAGFILGCSLLILGFAPEFTEADFPNFITNNVAGLRAVGILMAIICGGIATFGTRQGWWG